MQMITEQNQGNEIHFHTRKMWVADMTDSEQEGGGHLTLLEYRIGFLKPEETLAHSRACQSAFAQC